MRVWHTAGLCVSPEAAAAASTGCLRFSVLEKAQMDSYIRGPGFSPSMQRCGVTD